MMCRERHDSISAAEAVEEALREKMAPTLACRAYWGSRGAARRRDA